MSENPYMNPGMSMEQIKADSLHGVSAARQAWRQRDPSAPRAMGLGVEPEQQRLRAAAGGKESKK